MFISMLCEPAVKCPVSDFLERMFVEFDVGLPPRNFIDLASRLFTFDTRLRIGVTALQKRSNDTPFVLHALSSLACS